IKTGKPLIDRARLHALTSLYASPVCAAGRIYVTGRDGTTLVLKQADELDVLATNRLDDPIDASPVVVGKQLFLRGEKFLYCIKKGGLARWLFRARSNPSQRETASEAKILTNNFRRYIQNRISQNTSSTTTPARKSA